MQLESLTVMSPEEMGDPKSLRSRIKHISQLPVDQKVKAILIQRLMMGRFNKAEQKLVPKNESTLAEAINSVKEEDWLPTYHSEDVLGCPHYQRACKLQCYQCSKWVSCRFCHDEQQHEPAHNFVRNKTRWIMCMRCQNVQRPSRECTRCEEEFALYYCEKCKLYDNDEAKDIYHCDKCKLCRLGLGLGIDFFHCDGCHACLSAELQGNHKCIEGATMSNCPICGDYMFTSTRPVVYMSPCGHAIHQHCFEEHTRHSYKCPHCQVTVLNMDAQFRVLDVEIEEQPLPEPYCHWMCIVSCNDCKGRSKCSYHILGLKCGHCLSYNTAQLKLVKPELSSDVGADVAAFEQFDHTMNHTLREDLLHDHLQTEDVSPLINMDSTMLTNIDQYMDAYFKEEGLDRSKESRNVNDFINTSSLFDEETGKVSLAERVRSSIDKWRRNGSQGSLD